MLNNLPCITNVVWTVVFPVLLFFMFCEPNSMQTQINITETKIQEMVGQRQRRAEEIKLSLEEIKVSTLLFIFFFFFICIKLSTSLSKVRAYFKKINK